MGNFAFLSIRAHLNTSAEIVEISACLVTTSITLTDTCQWLKALTHTMQERHHPGDGKVSKANWTVVLGSPADQSRT
jgi:hypothetical protein